MLISWCMDKITINEILVDPKYSLVETFNWLYQLENQAINNPTFVKFAAQNFYSECSACTPGKIYDFMKKHFTYLPDDPFDERIQAPYILLRTKTGDCDDFALFSKTILDIIGGWYTAYILLGRSPGEFTHIATFAHRGRYLGYYRDPVVIDGAAPIFNYINPDYKYQKII